MFRVLNTKSNKRGAFKIHFHCLSRVGRNTFACDVTGIGVIHVSDLISLGRDDFDRNSRDRNLGLRIGRERGCDGDLDVMSSDGFEFAILVIRVDRGQCILNIQREARGWMNTVLFSAQFVSFRACRCEQERRLNGSDRRGDRSENGESSWKLRVLWGHSRLCGGNTFISIVQFFSTLLSRAKHKELLVTRNASSLFVNCASGSGAGSLLWFIYRCEIMWSGSGRSLLSSPCRIHSSLIAPVAGPHGIVILIYYYRELVSICRMVPSALISFAKLLGRISHLLRADTKTYLGITPLWERSTASFIILFIQVVISSRFVHSDDPDPNTTLSRSTSFDNDAALEADAFLSAWSNIGAINRANNSSIVSWKKSLVKTDSNDENSFRS